MVRSKAIESQPSTLRIFLLSVSPTSEIISLGTEATERRLSE